MKKQPEITDRTRQKFVDAFWALAKEKPVSKIAVSELTRLAGYNRSTFYEYFLDTDDLLSYVENKLIEDVKKVAQTSISDEKPPTEFFRMVFSAMNEEIYILLGPNGDSSFLSRVRAELIPLASKYIPVRPDSENFDYLIAFVNSAMFGLLERWHENNKDISPEEISELMQRLVSGGVMEYMKALGNLPPAESLSQ
ncbi:MAG: TetR family transcriptional regulator C-terminal domain-containing protein [Oscillospiraceae bacterium]|nr:TetR family transcriptional regulator C-terminal domain-containing protein [Oscillospiraceae bacterium]